MAIWITSLAHAPGYVKRHRPSHVVSLLSPYDDFPVFDSLGPDRHLQIGIHDINDDIGEWRAPGRSDVERLISFVQPWDRQSPILIHCWAGISRSSASAFITACLHNPDADEAEIARAVRAASPTAFPNRRLVAHADELMGRMGRMTAAVEAIGRGDVIAGEAVPFTIPSDFPAR